MSATIQASNNNTKITNNSMPCNVTYGSDLCCINRLTRAKQQGRDEDFIKMARPFEMHHYYNCIWVLSHTFIFNRRLAAVLSREKKCQCKDCNFTITQVRYNNTPNSRQSETQNTSIDAFYSERATGLELDLQKYIVAIMNVGTFFQGCKTVRSTYLPMDLFNRTGFVFQVAVKIRFKTS